MSHFFHFQLKSSEGKVTLSFPNEAYINKIKAASIRTSPPTERKMSYTLLEIERNRLALLDSKGN